ncbi:MAG: MBL fold metallo-hydrolase [Candidatus Shapirobacteria bacterium]
MIYNFFITNNIESLGGDGGFITGSCHRLNIDNSSVLIDHGMFQGKFEERSQKGERRNFTPTRNIARGVTDVLITHSHIDHIGRLPMIYKAGFSPNILATSTTAAFMEIMLRNSAEIQENEDPQNRLYDSFDVDEALRYVKIVKSFNEIQIGQKHSKMTAEFLPNGHVMGANSIIIRNIDKDKKHQNILFTGDMGKEHQSLCGGYLDQITKYPDDKIDVLLTESTNFLKEAIDFEEKKASLLNQIKKVWQEGGNVLLPVLSFHRMQEIIEILHNSDNVLGDCSIIIDAPLGVKILDAFKALKPGELSRRYGDDPNFYKNEKESLDRFNLKNVKILQSHQQSVFNDEALAFNPNRSIIIASGGMGEFGRAINYLRGKFSQNPKNAIIFTCHQVEGTPGAEMVHRSSTGAGKNKKAIVEKIDGFTSHISGPTQTFDFLNRFNLENLDKVIIAHGKNPSRQAMAQEFESRGIGKKIILPSLNQKIEI